MALALILLSVPLFLMLAPNSGLAQGNASAPFPAVSPQPRPILRVRSRSIVMGVRGLDTVEFERTDPDYAGLETLEQFVATDADLVSFAGRDKTRLVPIDSGSLVRLNEKEEADERAAGREIAGTILGNVALFENDSLQRYVNRIGRWVALRSDRPGLAWRFGVLDTEAINAFAVPGGWVFVTHGLIRKVSSESELAGVIGHEIAHVVSRDHFRLLQILGAIKRIGGGLQKASKGSEALQHATGKMFGNATRVMTMALDQQAELTADRIGMLLATDSGYEPFGLTRVLRLIEKEKQDSPKLALLSRTHPTPQKRVQSLDECATTRILSRANHPSRAREWKRSKRSQPKS